MTEMNKMSKMAKKIYIVPQIVAETITGTSPLLGVFPDSFHSDPGNNMPARRGTGRTSPVF